MIFLFRLQAIFFGLDSSWRENFLEVAFNLQMHLNMNHNTVYNLPVRYRNWYVKRLISYFDQKNNPDADVKKPLSNKKGLDDYENMLQNKFSNN